MEAEVIAQLVSNLGFPIACTVALFVVWSKDRQVHREESKQWADAINNNTIAMNALRDRLDRMEK